MLTGWEQAAATAGCLRCRVWDAWPGRDWTGECNYSAGVWEQSPSEFYPGRRWDTAGVTVDQDGVARTCQADMDAPPSREARLAPIHLWHAWTLTLHPWEGATHKLSSMLDGMVVLCQHYSAFPLKFETFLSYASRGLLSKWLNWKVANRFRIRERWKHHWSRDVITRPFLIKIEQNHYSQKHTLLHLAPFRNKLNHTTASSIKLCQTAEGQQYLLKKTRASTRTRKSVRSAKHCSTTGLQLHWQRMTPNMQNSFAQSWSHMANFKAKKM